MENRLGVLAFGDSITNGGGELQWGVALQSWALWTARGLGLPYTGCAVDGATAAHVAREQIPALRGARRRAGRALRRRLPLRRRQRRARRPAGTPAGTSATCGRRSRSSASAATACSSPRSRSTSAGRARARRRRGERADRARGGRRGRAGARPARLRRAQPGHGRRRPPDGVRPDRDRGARARRARGRRHDGAGAAAPLIAYETTRWRRLRGDATYAYRQAKQALRIALAAAEAVQRVRGRLAAEAAAARAGGAARRRRLGEPLLRRQHGAGRDLGRVGGCGLVVDRGMRTPLGGGLGSGSTARDGRCARRVRASGFRAVPVARAGASSR